MGDTNDVTEYEAWLSLAKKSYSEKLWNGKYYNYDSSASHHHDSIMSDQLAGFWYLRLSGHKYEVKLNFDFCLKLIATRRISKKNESKAR